MEVSLQLFMPVSSDGVLSQEASTIEANCGTPNWRGGQDITVRSHVTHNIQTFYCINTHRDNEGDITHWSYRSLDLKHHMVVFND